MRLSLLQLPYDSGRRGERTGAGPLALVEAGLPARLEASGHELEVETVELPAGLWTEVAAAVELQRRTAAAVGRAVAAGRLPVLLSGNDAAAILGVLGGFAPRRLAVAYFDAHGDFNTPETSPSGFFDGMTLAVATGHCWRAAAAGLTGFQPVPERHLALIGARALDPMEAELLAASEVARLDGSDPAPLVALLEDWRADPGGLYVHIDLDVLDPSELRANPWIAPGGSSRAGLAALLRAIRERLPPAAVAFTAYAPECDAPGKALEIVVEALGVLLGVR